MSKYESGTCNINKKESKKRYWAGGASLATGILFAISYTVLSSSFYILAFVFITFTLGCLGIFQGRKNFCVKHAKKGTEKTGEKEEKINKEEKIQKDKKTANKIILQSILIGALGTVAVYIARIILF